MQIHRGLENCDSQPAVITIGSFDGVHRGHRVVIDTMRNVAAERNIVSTVVTFEPHPREVLFPDEPPMKILSSFEEKARLLEEAGVDRLVVLPFSVELAGMDYATFVKEILIRQLNMDALVVGYDHSFGKDRKGNFKSLKVMSEELGFFLEQGRVFSENEINVSSTKIRRAIENGDLATAGDYLGYGYGCRGVVSKGYSLGRTLGFPTANILIDDERKLLPKVGVYAVRVHLRDGIYGGMLDIGYRPTVRTDGQLSIEVHIFGLDRNIYGQEISLTFVSRMRDEIRFSSKEELVEQLEDDRKIACHLLNIL